MKALKMAVFIGNRGFFPEKLIAGARQEISAALMRQDMIPLLMPESETRFGAVETAAEGRKFAAFLQAHRGEYAGVILCLPNFGDENGAVAALADCGAPILIQAYPDEIGQMDFQNRRDAFCGKFSVMDVFYQYGLPFTIFQPHTIHPSHADFDKQLRDFAAVCRVVRGMRRLTVGAIGARTTAFKTVRFDELTLQKYGITTEALDLSELFLRARSANRSGGDYAAKVDRLRAYTNWDGVPDLKFDHLVRLSLAIDELIGEYQMDCLALRCWVEIEKEWGVSPCVLLSELNDRGMTAACELDVGNAVAMRALSLAAGGPATCLDWNNNYGDCPDKCILFHCGPVPQSLMTAKGQVIDHPMFAKSFGAGCGWGCNIGRIAPSAMTFASSKTEDGELIFYTGEGRFTADPIEPAYFGCAGVAEIAGLQDKLMAIGRMGYRHHVSVAFGQVEKPVREALTQYLDYTLADI